LVFKQLRACRESIDGGITGAIAHNERPSQQQGYENEQGYGAVTLAPGHRQEIF
jgi:hypothetical protein